MMIKDLFTACGVLGISMVFAGIIMYGLYQLIDDDNIKPGDIVYCEPEVVGSSYFGIVEKVSIDGFDMIGYIKSVACTPYKHDDELFTGQIWHGDEMVEGFPLCNERTPYVGDVYTKGDIVCHKK